MKVAHYPNFAQANPRQNHKPNQKGKTMKRKYNHAEEEDDKTKKEDGTGGGTEPAPTDPPEKKEGE